MITKQQVVDEMVDRGLMEPVPGSEPATWRLTPSGQATNMIRTLTMTHVTVHAKIAQIHDFLEMTGEMLAGIQDNRPFTLDDFDLEEVEDIVEEMVAAKTPSRSHDRGYL
jgi:hypothetical protein